MDKSQRGLVKKAMRGNPKDFGTLIQQEQEYLYRMAFLYVRNEADALDVVQESILKAYKGLRSLREPEYFRTWLTKITINTAQDLLRKRSAAVPWEETEDLPAPQGLAPEEQMDLHRAIAQLPEKYRDVVKLKYFDGLPGGVTQAVLRFYDANRGQQVLAEFTIDLSAQTVTS